MKVVELLKIGGELLKTMSENDVKRDDWKFPSGEPKDATERHKKKPG